MSPHHEMLARVCDLLGAVPGVTVHAHRQARGVALIEFSVELESSAHALQRVGMGANVAIEPWEKGLLVPGSYSFVAPTKQHEGFSGLQLLGICLVLHLHRAGLLPAQQANALLKPWGAVEVGV